MSFKGGGQRRGKKAKGRKRHPHIQTEQRGAKKKKKRENCKITRMPNSLLEIRLHIIGRKKKKRRIGRSKWVDSITYNRRVEKKKIKKSL